MKGKKRGVDATILTTVASISRRMSITRCSRVGAISVMRPPPAADRRDTRVVTLACGDTLKKLVGAALTLQYSSFLS